MAWYRRQPASAKAIGFIVLAVLAGNGVFVSGLAIDNPVTWTAGIAQFVQCHVACGRPMIDPNVGFITQSLGHRAAEDLLHGHLPWWNYFEGLGQPLVGEMQSAALFPLTLLFAFSSGLLWFHMSLEIIAGVAAYLLARRLSIPFVIATGVGILFALNGTFAWLGNAVLNPVAFLPMLLLGIEMIFDGAKSGTRKGWYVAALALALSLYAGFPEVAYFDGLFCGAWAVVRLFDLPRDVRLVAARRTALAAGVGVVLSLPLLVPFYDFMKVANIGGHATAQQSIERLPTHAFSLFFDPYVFGTIFSNTNVNIGWGGIGGYFTISVTVLALLGLFGARLRSLRIFLGAWTVLAMFGAFNFLQTRRLWNLIPLVKSAGFGRYIMPSCELAMITLAAFGIMDFATSRRAKRLFTVTTLLGLAILVLSAVTASALNQGVTQTAKARFVFDILDSVPFVAVAALLVIGRFSKAKVAPLLLVLVLVCESVIMFAVPTGESPKSYIVDTAPISFLLAHQGEERFLDFGVIYPNWGSQFGLNSLSAIDLPFPKALSNLIDNQLEPGLSPDNQFVIHAGRTGIDEQETAVVNHFKSYEDASVKYLIIPDSIVISPDLLTLGVKLVFQDSLAAIYQMPHPRPFYSTTSAACTVSSSTVNVATVNCPSGGSTLIRTELSMAGWHAYVNGKEVAITTRDGVYQTIEVPSGTSAVTFSYLPPHEKYAVLVGLAALFFLIGAWIVERRGPRRKPRHGR